MHTKRNYQNTYLNDTSNKFQNKPQMAILQIMALHATQKLRKCYIFNPVSGIFKSGRRAARAVSLRNFGARFARNFPEWCSRARFARCARFPRKLGVRSGMVLKDTLRAPESLRSQKLFLPRNGAQGRESHYVFASLANSGREAPRVGFLIWTARSARSRVLKNSPLLQIPSRLS